MAPNFKVMGFTMTVAIASKWLLDTEDPGASSWGEGDASQLR